MQTIQPRHELRRNPIKTTVALVGAGAIGASAAATLGTTVELTLCRRPGNNRPMHVITPDSTRQHLRAHVATAPSEVQTADWVIVATKSTQVEQASPWLERLIGPATKALVLQNGIDHASRLANFLPAERVLPSTVHTVAERTGVDEVTVRMYNSILLPSSKLAEEFMALLLPHHPFITVDDFDQHSWRKLILNAAFNSITALTHKTAAVRDRPAVRETFRTAMKEGIAIALRAGITLPANEVDNLMKFIDAVPATASSSMRSDLETKRPLEAPFVTGTLLQHAQEYGITAPVLRTLDSLLVGAETLPV